MLHKDTVSLLLKNCKTAVVGWRLPFASGFSQFTWIKIKAHCDFLKYFYSKLIICDAPTADI